MLDGATLRGGWRFEFTTFTNVEPIRSRADVLDFSQRVGRVLQVLTGSDVRAAKRAEKYGFKRPPWVGGSRSIEVGKGRNIHAHCLAVSGLYPFGYNVRKLWGMQWPPKPIELGMRALLRDNGLGEVFKVEQVVKSRDAARLYISKGVTLYVGKSVTVEAANVTEEDARVQWWLRGTRRVAAFGALVDTRSESKADPSLTWHDEPPAEEFPHGSDDIAVYHRDGRIELRDDPGAEAVWHAPRVVHDVRPWPDVPRRIRYTSQDRAAWAPAVASWPPAPEADSSPG